MSRSLDRAATVDENFSRLVKAAQFPPARAQTTLSDAGITPDVLRQLFIAQAQSRHLDLAARQLKDKGQGFYTIGSSGHEGNAAFGYVFDSTHMAFCHYRSAAFLLARAQSQPDIPVLREQAQALVAARSCPISGGRHKVIGSVKLNIPPQTSTIASHLPKAVGTAFAILKARAMGMHAPLNPESAVLCSFGDASWNHSTAQGAFNAAAWIMAHQGQLPLVMICEDNGLGISVPTPKTWILDNMSARPHWHTITCDGRHLPDVIRAAKLAYQHAVIGREPVFIQMKTVRLLGHAGSDVESQYRSWSAIEAAEADDPLLHTARLLHECGLSISDIQQDYEQVRADVDAAVTWALSEPKLENADAVMASLIPQSSESRRPTQQIITDKQPRHMAQLLNFAFQETLAQIPQSVFFGEDVGKKGGVYRLTADLQAKFGVRRVWDAPLDEQTILGTAIGLAHNGFLPIPEIQFIAYLHNAIDQVRGEAATLPFFSNAQYKNPMIMRLPGLAYQKGFGGHFHNENAIAFLREIPGLIIACPSSGHKAVLLWRQCVAQAYCHHRLVAFIEPIALYMVKDTLLAPFPAPEETIALGDISVSGQGRDLLIVSYGNGHYLSQQAMVLLTKQGINITLVDLNWIAPLPIVQLAQIVPQFERVLIVDESRQTGSISEAIITGLYEHCQTLPQLRRLCGKDTFIPTGHSWQHVLPSVDDIVRIATQMCEGATHD